MVAPRLRPSPGREQSRQTDGDGRGPDRKRHFLLFLGLHPAPVRLQEVGRDGHPQWAASTTHYTRRAAPKEPRPPEPRKHMGPTHLGSCRCGNIRAQIPGGLPTVGTGAGSCGSRPMPSSDPRPLVSGLQQKGPRRPGPASCPPGYPHTCPNGQAAGDRPRIPHSHTRGNRHATIVHATHQVPQSLSRQATPLRN